MHCWIPPHCHNHPCHHAFAVCLQSQLLSCITDSIQDTTSAQGPVHALLAPEQLQQVLALRGMLACNLLQLCLRKRHLVDYGRWGALWQ
jgi:hypothetical protein